METTALKLYSLEYKNAKTYLVASLFIVGNILLPQLCHLVPNGGFTLLPIYFFTLIGAYKYGWRVGLLTAILSPLINYLLFGMPMATVLPVIMFKSVLLALAAGFAAKKYQRISILILMIVVLSYQILGTLGEWAFVGNLELAIQDFRMGIPGMLLQIFGGYLFIKYLLNK
ncbi:ECF transporter S component [Dysgonomonas sp. Marseille-P4677]|uniref:ECF transporter S component n=1 Tax=Dysgonomonas sp. Marseille-P4677 TaxID=2364790 RepID=UPI0019115A5E|nr:ECF transporter S component [Dysgonomonas sp. Marseille-P4677]MBK5722795.1 ECF transporter S component [Dysgonomonas sp. Marseille-P4677]